MTRKRIYVVPELAETIKLEAEENSEGIDPRVAQAIAQKRIANSMKELRKNFELPKYKVEFNLENCQIKTPFFLRKRKR